MKHFFLLFLMLASVSMFSQEPPPGAPAPNTGITVPSLFGAIRGRQIGPAVMSGRISDIDASKKNPAIIYVGSAGGGVWKSNDAGGTFSPVFDDYIQSIGKVTIDQAHPDTVWVGTGEPWVRNSVSVGAGIYLTTNGGKTWEMKGLEKTERITDIVIDPTNSSIIYVAALGHLWNGNPDRGLYKSTDGGATWNKILFVDDNTGCADIDIDPKNPNVVYAAMWEFRRYPDMFNSGGKGSGLHKSTDGGKTWKKIQNGIPPGILGRMAIAVAPTNPNTVYLTVECEKKEEMGLYKSTDAGANWKKVNGDFNTKVRPFYFSRMYVDPNDENKIFKCGLNLTISKDGGTSFVTITSGVHSDIHCVWVDPNNSKQMLLGCDGGVCRSLDGGSVWTMFMNLPVSQFYHVAVDNEMPYNVYGGLQDNGSWYAPNMGPGGVENSDWKLTCYGDGFWSFPHPTDKNVVYSESQGGDLVRFNKDDGRQKDIKPIESAGEPEYRFNWSTPIHVSPTNPERLYFGAQFLFMSENRGDTWKKISPDLSSNDPARQRFKNSGGLSPDKSGAENHCTIYNIAESPANEKIIWVGTDDGQLQVTSNGGTKWENVAKNTGAPAFTWVSDVEPSRFDPNTCYATLDGHRTGDMTPRLYKTTDLGKTWVSIITPDVEGYTWCIKEDLKNKNLLFLGTEFGLYISVDGGKSWARFSNNFPKVAVHDMAIHPRDNDLVCATHGRGIIILDNISPLREISEEIVAKDFHVLASQTGIIRYYPAGAPFGGAGNFIGENPDRSAKILYYQRKRHTFGKMEIEVYDEKGNLFKTLPAAKAAGINMVTIPLNLPIPKAAPTNNRSAFGNGFGSPDLPDGTYTVKIKKGKEEFTTNVTVAHEPNSPYTKEELRLQNETLMKLYNLIEQLGYTYYALEDMHKAAEKSPAAAKDKAFLDFAKRVKEVKDGIVSLEGDFYVDESENLRERLSKLYGGVSRYPGRPTDGQVRKAGEMAAEVAAVVAKFDAFKKELTSLNGRLTAAGLPLITFRSFEEFKKD